MINLYEFYFENVTQEHYHYLFFDSIEKVNKEDNKLSGCCDSEVITKFELFDDEDIIEKFKYLCKPNTQIDTDENKCWFYLICFYLHYNGYYIEQFKDVLRRPPIIPSDFSYGEIRTYLLDKGSHRNGTVTYYSREILVSKLIFKRSVDSIGIGFDIDGIFQKISTRKASFQNMTIDEKIMEISNLIENMLKKEDGYLKLDYTSIAFEYINDEIIKKYRHQIQCFRHASEEAIRERQAYNETQKEFFIDIGITIAKVIYSLIKISHI